MKKIIRFILLSVLLFSSPILLPNLYSEEKKQSIFIDPTDGYFDLSDFIINKKGFVPVPIIITEPALGGFGLAIAPVFIQPNKPIERNGKRYPVAPDITAGAGGYTLNNTWMAGLGRMGYLPKWDLRYMIGGGYGNVNMDYYFNLPNSGKNVKAEFNIETIPATLSVTKILKDPRFSVGLGYMYMHNKLKINDDLSGPIIDEIQNKIEDAISGNVSKFRIKLDFDTRDNIFTPNKGLFAYLNTDWSNEAFGSDYNYGVFNGEVFYYLPILKNLISGFRFNMQQSVGNQPFYLKPYINMRGVPTARYQGKTLMLVEVEERWDFVPRWSALVFGGTGKAFDDFSKAAEADIAWSYGTGLRYLLARKLNLRMGLDLAMGPEGPTYYIVFGSSWIRE